MTSERRRRPRRRWTVAAAVLTSTALAGGCTSDWDAAPVFDDRSATRISTLRAVQDCDELVERAQASLAATVEAQWAWSRSSGEASSGAAGAMEDQAGFSGGSEQEALAVAPSTTAAPAGSERSSGGDADQGAATPSGNATRQVIGTNTQEAEVDEADIVKTDGRRVVALVDGVLRVVVLDEDPGLDGSLSLLEQAPAEMFLRGDEVVIVGSGGGGVVPMAEQPNTPVPGSSSDSTREIAPSDPVPTTAPRSTIPPSPVTPPPFSTSTSVTVVSLADPSAPAVTDSTTIEGAYVSSRMVDGRIRLIVRGEPQAANEVAMAPDEDRARAVVRTLDASALLPRRTVGTEVEPLGSCADVMVLASEAAADGADGADGDEPVATTLAPNVADSSFTSMPAISTITALTIGDSLDDLQPTTIQGNAETVYASTEALYVTASGWDEGGPHTQVHRFALPADGPAAHTGSGRAPGALLNQFSLSERDGVLRVVTTLDGSGIAASEPALRGDAQTVEPAIGRGPVSQGRLTVLDTEGDTLDEIGHLDGLGPGEQVKSVRFVEDLAYVVTFRTTDPLYALDLSDPSAPRLLGELKIPGFSEYLHPLGDGLLLGVGRDADPDTGIERGFKVSLFDISDPAAMSEVDQLIVPDASSPVSGDHRAFLWDAGRRQAVVPVEAYGSPERSGAMVLRVDGGRLQQVANLHHDGFGGVPMRSFVVDDQLWTLSMQGLASTSADTPGTLVQLPF
jgi:hypothetical protein